MHDDPAALAKALIEAQRTMVLATAHPDPWAAPVYYLFRDARFYFFSSPDSRHVTDALAAARCAASIFRDADDWRRIEGLQMDGALERVEAGSRAADAFSAYLARFPTVLTFFDDEPPDLPTFLDRFRARLYAFIPRTLFYLNNGAGFATRREIQLPG